MTLSFWGMFVVILMAEMGDKTQLATMLLVTQGYPKWLVWAAVSAALTCSAFVAVTVGGWLVSFVHPRLWHMAAGMGFVVIGCVLLYQAWGGEA